FPALVGVADEATAFYQLGCARRVHEPTFTALDVDSLQPAWFHDFLLACAVLWTQDERQGSCMERSLRRLGERCSLDTTFPRTCNCAIAYRFAKRRRRVCDRNQARSERQPTCSFPGAFSCVTV